MDSQLAEEPFGFRKGKGTRDAIGFLRIIMERSMKKRKNVYAVFVDLEKAFDKVEWPKMMGALRDYGIDGKKED